DGSVTIHRLPIAHRRSGSPAWLAFEYLAFPLMAAVYLTLLDRRRRFELVQVNSVPDWLVFAAFAPRRRGVPVLLNLFECVPEFFATKLGTRLDHPVVRLLGRLERMSIRFATFAITCTEHQRDAFLSRRAPAERIAIVMNGA